MHGCIVTLLAVYTVALSLGAFLAVALIGGQRNGPPMIALGGMGLSGALIVASWLVPVVVVTGPVLHWETFTPHAPLARWVHLLAQDMGAVSATRLPLASALFALMTCGICLVFLRQMSKAGLAVVMGLAVAIVVSPRMPGSDSASWSDIESRWALGLSVPLIVALCLPQGDRGAIAAFLLGLGLAGLALLDPGYATGVLAVMVVALLVGRISLWQAMLALAGLTTGLVLEDSMAGPVLPWLMTAGSEPNLHLLPRVAGWFGVSVLLSLAMTGAREKGADWASWTLLLALGGLAVVTDLIGLVALMPLLVAEASGMLRSATKPALAPGLWAGLSGLALVAGLAGAARDMASVLAQHLLASEVAPVAALAQTPLRDLAVVPGTPAAQQVARMTEAYEALDTLGAGLPQTGRIEVMGEANPFGLLFGKPDRGRVTFVVVPLSQSEASRAELLAAGYSQVTDLDHWTIWAR